MSYDASFIIGGGSDGTSGSGDIYGPGNTGGSYSISTSGSGGLGDILTTNSNSLVSALSTVTSNIKESIVSGSLANKLAMDAIKGVLEKNGLDSKEYMTKKSEHLDYAKNGNPDLKNSSGEKINPRDEQSKYYSEKRIDEERANTTDLSGVLDSIDSDSTDSDIDYDVMSKVIKDIFASVDLINIKNNLKEGE